MIDATSQPFTDSGGLAGEYHIYGAGLPSSGAGLVVHLHGDAAYEYLNPTDNYALAGNRGLIAVAKAKGYALLVPKAPDTTGTVTWWEAGARNAQWLSELLVSIYAGNGIDNTKVWLVGYSGGAEFISYYFVPGYGKARIGGGGALILGGGGGPAAVTPVGWDSAFKAAFPMTWITGGQDDGTYASDSFNALSAASSGKSYYAGQGFTTTISNPPGIDHEIDGAFGPMLDDVLPTLAGYSPPSRAPGSTLPTLVTSYLVTNATTGTTTTPSFTPSAGEVIVVKCWNANLNSPNIAAVVGGGLTYATKNHIQATSHAEAWIFVGEVGATSPGSMTVSVSWFGTSGQHGIIVERWSSGLVKGVPAQSTPVLGSGAPSATLTPARSNSVLTWINADWNVIAGTATYRTSATQTQTSATSAVRAYAAYQEPSSTSAQTVGLSAPTGQAWSLGAIELLPGPSGGGSSPVSVRRNLSPNPALKNNTTGNATNWTSSPSGYVRQTGVTGMTRTTGFGGSGAIDIVTTPRFAAVAGQQYMASIQVKTGASNTFKMLINWYAGVDSGAFIGNSGTSVPFTVNGTQRCEIGPFTAPTGAGGGYLRIIELDATTVTLTALMVEQTSASGNSYFDGDSTGASWDGTAGNSTSTLSDAADTVTWTDSGSVTVTPSGPTGHDTASFVASGSIVAANTINQGVTWSDAGMIFSCDYDPRRGRNRISARGLPTAGIRAIVDSRPENRSAWRTVRGGKVGLSSGAFVRTVDDYEFVAARDNTYRIRVLSTPENVADVVVSSVTVTLPATNPGVWLKFIVQPALNQQVQLVDWSEIGRSSRVTLYDVVGRTDPVAVTDVHSSRKITVTLRTISNTEADRLDDALSQGRPLFLHVPDALALPSMYAVAGDYSATRPSKTTSVRLWQVALVEVAPPPSSAAPPPTTWQNIRDAYTTWQDVIDAFPTWQDVVS